MQSENTSSHDGHQPDDEPQLISPLPPLSSRTWISLSLVFAAASFFAMMTKSVFDGRQSDSQPPLLSMSAGEVPGMLVTVDQDLIMRPVSRSKLAMDEADKQRLQQKLAEGQLRLGKIEVWDTVDEDGDRVRIEAVGFTQDVTILHKPQVFLVPFMPGGTIRISAIHDGGGGGVTLGVSTILGPTPLPALSLGQAVEIPVL